MPARARKRSSPSPSIAVVYSRYNHSITESLVLAAVETCAERTGYTPAVFEAPGSYELTALCMAAARTGRFDGIVALGCIIKGETSHDQHIAQAVAHGLTNVTLLTDVPVAFGVLTTNNAKQARERAGLGKDPSANKGHEAMTAVLVARGDQILFRQVYGMADIQNGVPLRVGAQPAALR